MKISVVIRNKNEAEALEFLLMVLAKKYHSDIDEVIVLDNLSKDNSLKVCQKYGARLVTVEQFSYGGSANIAGSEAKNDIVVIFSAHSYPVSHDFFKIIKEKFISGHGKLAGVRCIHNNTDYRQYLKSIPAEACSNLSGLIFSGSAFSRSIWEKHPFNADVRTFEDKEWTIRMLQQGYRIEVVPCIFSYQIKRTPAQLFFRFKNDTIGGYQIFGIEPSVKHYFYTFLVFFINSTLKYIESNYYNLRRFLFILHQKLKGFKRFKLHTRAEL